MRYLLAGACVLNQGHQRLYQKDLVDKLQILAGFVPKTDYWMGSKFTLIDIFMGYVLQLAVKSELVSLDNIKTYLLRLMDRPAAQSSKMFTALNRPD